MDIESARLVSRYFVGTTVIAAAFALSIPVYVAAAWILVGETGQAFIEPERLMPFMTKLLAAGAVFELVSAEVVHRVMLRELANRDSAEGRLIGYRTSTVISNGLREAAAITGLVATLLTADIRWCIAFGAAALLAILIAWPRRAAMERLVSDPKTRPIG